LVELDENRRKACDHLPENQDNVKGKFNRKAQPRIFRKGDIVLMWNKRSETPSKHGKFDSFWLGPCKVKDVADPNTFYLSHLA